MKKKTQKGLKRISNKLEKLFDEFPRRFRKKDSSKIYLISNKHFVNGCADIIEGLIIDNVQGVILTFDNRTRQLAEQLQRTNIDVKDAFFIDCISYATGKGTPPVLNLISLNQPDEFENIFYYTVIQLSKTRSESSFVVVIAPYALLDYTSYDEIAVLFRWFKDRLDKIGIPLIFIYKENENRILDSILTRLVKHREESV